MFAIHMRIAVRSFIILISLNSNTNSQVINTYPIYRNQVEVCLSFPLFFGKPITPSFKRGEKRKKKETLHGSLARASG